MRFLGFTGVAGESGVVSSVARIAPRLVCFVHVTRWNFGEAECSHARFLVMVTREDSRLQVAMCVEVDLFKDYQQTSRNDTWTGNVERKWQECQSKQETVRGVECCVPE